MEVIMAEVAVLDWNGLKKLHFLIMFSGTTEEIISVPILRAMRSMVMMMVIHRFTWGIITGSMRRPMRIVMDQIILTVILNFMVALAISTSFQMVLF